MTQGRLGAKSPDLPGQLRRKFVGAVCPVVSRGDRLSLRFQHDTDRQRFLTGFGGDCEGECVRVFTGTPKSKRSETGLGAIDDLRGSAMLLSKRGPDGLRRFTSPALCVLLAAFVVWLFFLPFRRPPDVSVDQQDPALTTDQLNAIQDRLLGLLSRRGVDSLPTKLFRLENSVRSALHADLKSSTIFDIQLTLDGRAL